MALQLLDTGLAVPAVFTTLIGGVSGHGHGGTNLSLKSDDEPARTLTNRDLLAREVGLRDVDLAFAQQVHGPRVAVVAGQPSQHARTAGLQAVDALVTRTPGVGLVVLAADCMPVLFADLAAGVVGAAHSGRPGLALGVLQATVAAMRDLGATDIAATVGPCIGGCCYELPEALADEVARVVPAARSTTTWGTPSIDLRSGADAVLADAGVSAVHHVGGCTYEQPDLLYSYRRDGTADRHGGIVRLP